MSTFSLKFFLKNHDLKIDTMIESELQKFFNYLTYPRDSIIYSDEGFIKIDKGEQGGSHWCAFYVKNNKSHYFVSFGVQPVKFLLKRLPEPFINHK